MLHMSVNILQCNKFRRCPQRRGNILLRFLKLISPKETLYQVN
jgi:hypothetical protein